MTKTNVTYIPLTKRWGAEFFTNDKGVEQIYFIDRKYAKNDGGEWDKGQPTMYWPVATIAGHKGRLAIDFGQNWFVDADAATIAGMLCEARI